MPDEAENPGIIAYRWSPSTVAVVTGANKGIGYEIARILATEGFTTVVASRNTELGNAAVSQLKAAQPDAAVDFVQLDITDAASVAACAEALKVKYGRVDILVNNAGIAYKGSIFGAEEAATTMNCNLKGTRSISEAVLPLMPEGGRIVNLCSRCLAAYQHVFCLAVSCRLYSSLQHAWDVCTVAGRRVVSLPQ